MCILFLSSVDGIFENPLHVSGSQFLTKYFIQFFKPNKKRASGHLFFVGEIGLCRLETVHTPYNIKGGPLVLII